MDEMTIFYTLLGLFFLYHSSKQIIDVFTSDIFEVSDIFEAEKPIVKYEDKFSPEIRKLDKEFQFDEREKALLQEKEKSFFITTENNYKKKRKEITDRLSDIEVQLSSEEIQENSELYIEVEKLNELLSDKLQILNNAKEFALNFIINLRIEKLLHCYVMETTPQGNVLMIYDHIKGSFRYYSDNAIPYRYLEVVARKYVKQFNCRPLYVDMEEELEIAEKRWEKEREKKEEQKKEEQKKEKDIVPERKNVFAKFKSYNKEGTNGRVNVGVPPKNSIPITKEQEKEKILLKERANRYTYEGKFINFSFLKKVERKVVDKKYNLSFSDFKKINKN